MYGNKRQLTDSKQNIVLRQGSYGNGKTEFQDFFRTFSFFKDSISSQFCIRQSENAPFFQPEASRWKGALDFFDSDTGDKNQDYRINWIEKNSSCTSLFDVYLAIFSQFFLRFSHSFSAHPINLKGLVVFLYFSKTNSYFQEWFVQNSRTKGSFFSNSMSFPRQGQIQGLFQVCANPVRACLILFAKLTPKFNLWIYVGVMECR